MRFELGQWCRCSSAPLYTLFCFKFKIDSFQAWWFTDCNYTLYPPKKRGSCNATVHIHLATSGVLYCTARRRLLRQSPDVQSRAFARWSPDAHVYGNHESDKSASAQICWVPSWPQNNIIFPALRPQKMIFEMNFSVFSSHFDIIHAIFGGE